MEEFDQEFDTLQLNVFSNTNMAAAFKCEKCTEVRIPTNPYGCDKGHIFCKKCLDESVENNEKCPNGHHEILNSNENVPIKNIINGLQIMCPMNDKFEDKKENNISDQLECEWKGSVAELFAHLPECPVYIELNKVFENDIALNQLKQIKEDNISMKQTMNEMALKMTKMALQITNSAKELKKLKHSLQNENNDDNDDTMEDQDDKKETNIIGTCNKCNTNVEYSYNNIQIVNNKWQHVNCNYKPILLAVTDNDIWSDVFISASVIIDKQAVMVDPQSTAFYRSVFGSITVDTDTGIKQWKIRINKLANSNIFIGVINAFKLCQSQSSTAYQNGISLHANGTIYRFDKGTYQCGYQFKQGDIVTIILDINNRLLVFKINRSTITVSVNDLNIDLRKYKWKLYASLYNPGDQIVLLNSDKQYESGDVSDDEKTDNAAPDYECSKCTSLISKRDFKVNNIHWSAEHQWQHSDCSLSKYKLPNLLHANKPDEFNKLLAFKADIALSNGGRTFMSTKSSVYQTVYGVMSITTGQKVWSIKIDSGTPYMYVGIIESDKIPDNAANSTPNAGTYYLAWNGQVGGSGLNSQSGITYATGDVINVILDLNQYTLGFGRNNDKYVLVNGVNLKNKSFNIFCTLYAINNSMSFSDAVKDGMNKPEITQPIDLCQQCNNNIFSTDFDLQNVIWNETNNKWNHINCNLEVKVPDLELLDTDMWHPFLSNPEIQIYEKYTSIGGSSSYWNVFGVISVNQGIKKWDVRINVQPSYSYIGVIDSNAMKNRKVGIPSSNGYYLTYHGYIQGGSLSISMNCTLKVNDVVTIILDKNKKTLCFGVNYNNFKYAKGAVLNGSYNLFYTSYYQNTSVTILGDAEGKDDEKEEGQCIGKCMKCSRNLFDSDLKLKNVTWNDMQNKWCHTDCNAKKKTVPNLRMADIDQWNPKLTNSCIQITDGYNFIGGASTYCNAFGVISVNNGVKVWTLRINQQPSYLFVGIIDTRATKHKQIGLPSNEGYYLAHNGLIQGRGLSISTGYTLKVKDKIKIILDLTQNTLCFGINDKTFVYAKGAMLKNRCFNLFCTAYYQNTSVTILGKEMPGSTGIEKGKILYTCGSCSKAIYEMDFQINNVKNNSNAWYHIECNFNLPQLSVNARDQWNRMISNRDINIQNYDANVGTGGGYFNVFGIITITKNTKRWNVKIVNQPSGYIYVGIIDSGNLYGRQVTLPSSDCYYLAYNGYIQGSGLSINAGLAFKTGDVINVILDMNKGVLSFGRNNTDYAHAKNANIKGRSFNLFCNMYYANSKVTIQS